MHAARTKNVLNLTFSSVESQILQQVLRQIRLNYQTKPEDLDPKAASAWYSTRGCASARMSADETREWLENLHQYRGANVQHLEEWARRLSLPRAGRFHLNIKLDQAPILLTALNDHRLFVAARHDIGQEEMDLHSLLATGRLRPAQQTALSEIHLLACIIEHILRFMPGNPAGWMEAL